MGASSSKLSQKSEAASDADSGNTMKSSIQSVGCPVMNNSKASETSSSPTTSNPTLSQPQTACPVMGRSSPPNASQAQSSCPVMSKPSGVYKNPHVYNVYSQEIDPKNQMPAVANQMPSPSQEKQLSVERTPSTIPKGGTEDSTWLYPSPQMFYNALVRKNKVDGAKEEDMDAVVKIHNNMNESTWIQVLSWEQLHCPSDGRYESGREPKLLKFIGKPHDLSPKAQIKILFGHPQPFDRHDWVVDRGGQEVRYIIDYYSDESAVTNDQLPKHLKDVSSMQSIKVDVRPALDSPTAIFDRTVRMPFMQLLGSTTYQPPPFFAPQKMIRAEENKAMRLGRNWKDIQGKCALLKDKMKNCETEEKCGAASVSLQLCMAGIVCPSVAEAFNTCVRAVPQDDSKTGSAYSAVVKCLELFEVESRK